MRGRPQQAQSGSSIRSNSSRHGSQIGMRLAARSAWPQMRQGAGNSTEASASMALLRITNAPAVGRESRARRYCKGRRVGRSSKYEIRIACFYASRRHCRPARMGGPGSYRAEQPLDAKAAGRQPMLHSGRLQMNRNDLIRAVLTAGRFPAFPGRRCSSASTARPRGASAEVPARRRCIARTIHP